MRYAGGGEKWAARPESELCGTRRGPIRTETVSWTLHRTEKFSGRNDSTAGIPEPKAL